MHKLLIALASAVVLLVGCQGGAAVKSDSAAKAAISDEANKALVQAEADVKAAKAAGHLWTTADQALKDAKEAAAKGDSAAVIKNAKTASEQAKLGAGQASYPPKKMP